LRPDTQGTEPMAWRLGRDGQQSHTRDAQARDSKAWCTHKSEQTNGLCQFSLLPCVDGGRHRGALELNDL